MTTMPTGSMCPMAIGVGRLGTLSPCRSTSSGSDPRARRSPRRCGTVSRRPITTNYHAGCNIGRGELAYVPGGPLPAGIRRSRVDRNGAFARCAAGRQYIAAARLTGGASRPFARTESGSGRTSGGTSTAVTETPAYPVWTPDGKRIAFTAGATGNRNLFWMPADGTGVPERLTTSEFPQWPSSWSKDGRTLLFMQATPATKNDIWALDVSQRPPVARPVIRTPGYDWAPTFSPDGRWLAYSSDESGVVQVYVQPYPALDSRHPVSVNGGGSPVWSRDGHRLFFFKESNSRKPFSSPSTSRWARRSPLAPRGWSLIFR